MARAIARGWGPDRLFHRHRALPLKAELLDQDGSALTDADLSATPVVQVT